MPQIICCEVGTSLDDIVCCLAQELLIAGIVVIIPEMGSNHGPANGEKFHDISSLDSGEVKPKMLLDTDVVQPRVP